MAGAEVPDPVRAPPSFGCSHPRNDGVTRVFFADGAWNRPEMVRLVSPNQMRVTVTGSAPSRPIDQGTLWRTTAVHTAREVTRGSARAWPAPRPGRARGC
ncbi:hypothetical protein GCM10010151_14440 [Actinoallomurus spadix]|uniref:Uncharacterized protein n=1 Tax=Actinoallomurus spadix TaxID=79912 RepID=A0ABN0W5A7_9ACTN